MQALLIMMKQSDDWHITCLSCLPLPAAKQSAVSLLRHCRYSVEVYDILQQASVYAIPALKVQSSHLLPSHHSKLTLDLWQH